jgi:UDP-glucose 4-epimerase
VRKSPAATVQHTAEAIIDIFKHKKGIKNIGIREGEKMHETLVTREELMKAESFDHYYRIENLKKLDYDEYFIKGKKKHFLPEGYTSENTTRLSLKGTKDLLLSLKEIKDAVK